MYFDDCEGTPPQLPSMWVNVFRWYEGPPLQLHPSVVNVLGDYEVTPPQLPSMVLSVLETLGPPPKVLMVPETEQLPPPLFFSIKKKTAFFK